MTGVGKGGLRPRGEARSTLGRPPRGACVHGAILEINDEQARISTSSNGSSRAVPPDGADWTVLAAFLGMAAVPRRHGRHLGVALPHPQPRRKRRGRHVRHGHRRRRPTLTPTTRSCCRPSSPRGGTVARYVSPHVTHGPLGARHSEEHHRPIREERGRAIRRTAATIAAQRSGANCAPDRVTSADQLRWTAVACDLTPVGLAVLGGEQRDLWGRRSFSRVAVPTPFRADDGRAPTVAGSLARGAAPWKAARHPKHGRARAHRLPAVRWHG